jgi:hypothetical protein
MKDHNSDRLKKLRSNIFSHTDIVEMDFMYQKLCDKKFANDYSGLLASNFLNELESTIKSGPMWKFNPTCLNLFIKENSFQYDRVILEKNILENGHITCQEIDKNLNLYTLCFTIEILAINTNDISDELISKCEFVAVKSMGGTIVI